MALSTWVAKAQDNVQMAIVISTSILCAWFAFLGNFDIGYIWVISMSPLGFVHSLGISKALRDVGASVATRLDGVDIVAVGKPSTTVSEAPIPKAAEPEADVASNSNYNSL